MLIAWLACLLSREFRRGAPRATTTMISCIQYNPLSATSEDRLEEISTEFRFAHVVALTGTQRRARQKDEVTQATCGRHRVYHWGHYGARLTNKAAGCSFLLHKRYFREPHVHTVFVPPSALQGRAAALRLRSGRLDLTPIALYFPPRPTSSEEWKKYRGSWTPSWSGWKACWRRRRPELHRCCSWTSTTGLPTRARTTGLRASLVYKRKIMQGKV
mmetsp:Transcript_69844/g.197903  ORF Transcript_69844/g.197903 Transcript_69844/m.197903 type:complete len:216 (-) Transcript_69844:2846-3493(-)